MSGFDEQYWRERWQQLACTVDRSLGSDAVTLAREAYDKGRADERAERKAADDVAARIFAEGTQRTDVPKGYGLGGLLGDRMTEIHTEGQPRPRTLREDAALIAFEKFIDPSTHYASAQVAERAQQYADALIKALEDSKHG